ncbi:unnamed protein product, partial [Cyprideis torosa]
AKTGEKDLLRGLDVGADDYIGKPFSNAELRGRVKAVLRRTARFDQGALRYAPLTMDASAMSAAIDGLPLDLSSIEFRLLQQFVKHPGRVYSRAMLLDRVWGMNSDVNERTVDVSMRRLRKALAKSPLADHLETVYGSGYRLRRDPAPEGAPNGASKGTS